MNVHVHGWCTHSSNRWSMEANRFGGRFANSFSLRYLFEVGNERDGTAM